MNIEAVNDAHALFQNGGYNGTVEDFQSLIATNDEALSDAHKLFIKGGYTGDVEQFSTLVGVKKKDEALGLDSESEEVVTTSDTEEVEQATPSDSSNGKCPDGQFFNKRTGKCEDLPTLTNVKEILTELGDVSPDSSIEPDTQPIVSDIQEPTVPTLQVEDKVDTTKVEEVKSKIAQEKKERDEYEDRSEKKDLEINEVIEEETDQDRVDRLESEGLWLDNYIEILESNILGDNQVIAPGEMAQNKSQLVKDYITQGDNRNLKKIPVYDEIINEGLFTSSEEEVVPALQKLYGDWDFKFEESNYYLPDWLSTEDAMLVTAPNKKTLLLKLDTSSGKEEADKLKSFLRDFFLEDSPK